MTRMTAPLAVLRTRGHDVIAVAAVVVGVVMVVGMEISGI